MEYTSCLPFKPPLCSLHLLTMSINSFIAIGMLARQHIDLTRGALYMVMVLIPKGQCFSCFHSPKAVCSDQEMCTSGTSFLCKDNYTHMIQLYVASLVIRKMVCTDGCSIFQLVFLFASKTSLVL